MKPGQAQAAGAPATLKSPGDYIERANQLFDTTAAAFVARSPDS